MNVLEVGSSLGASTHILSHLFREVTALDNLAIRHEKSKELNKNRDNIIYKVMDVYSQQWDFENMDVVFIDCVHDYQHVKQDINNSIINFDNPILVFDDYGLFPEIKKAVDEYIEEGKLKLIKKIGHYPGNVFPKTQYKILKDREGLICSVIK
jgi:tRNA A58 N-methylase Trm61